MVTIKQTGNFLNVDWVFKSFRQKFGKFSSVESERFELFENISENVKFWFAFNYNGSLGLLSNTTFPKLTFQLNLISTNGLEYNVPLTQTAKDCRGGDYDVLKVKTDFIGPDGTCHVRASIVVDSRASNGQDCGDNIHRVYGQAFDEQLCTDIKLVANDGQCVMASKFVLSAHSDVFKAMFCGDFAEKNDHEVVIEDVRCEPLRTLVKYMYDRTLELKDTKFAVEVMFAADKYNVQLVKKRCEVYITDHINNQSVLTVIELADKLNAKVLYNRCIHFLTKKSSSEFDSVVGWNEFTNSNVLRTVIHHISKRPLN